VGSRDSNIPHRLPSHEAEARQRTILLRIFRGGFLILFFTVTLLFLLRAESGSSSSVVSAAINWGVWVSIAVAIALLVVVIDVFIPRKKISTLSAMFLGLLASLAATWAISAVLELVVQSWLDSPQAIREFAPFMGLIKVLVGIAMAYLCISTILQTQDDFRLVIPYVEFAKQLRGPRPLILDTSVLIDARIVDIAGTGVLQAPLVIPKFVVNELQTLADSSERIKRARGRRGLDVIGRLQRAPTLDVSIDETRVPGIAVDQMLVELARMMSGMVVTGDAALDRVAKIQGVSVLNIHELAGAMRPAAIPGDTLVLELIKRGEQPGQGVGYLEDGTMVVCEDGAGQLGSRVTVLVTSSMQTAAGRLIFARLFRGEGDRIGASDRGGPHEGDDADTTPSIGTPAVSHAEPEDDDAGEPELNDGAPASVNETHAEADPEPVAEDAGPVAPARRATPFGPRGPGGSAGRPSRRTPRR
jgi:uncharacterized protein YacL